MLSLIMNAIGVACVLMIVWYLIRVSLPKMTGDGDSDSITMDDYLLKITRVTGISAYDTFRMSAEEWRIPAERMEQDFTIYLATQKVPYYVKDVIRKSRKQIDELYWGSGGYAFNKKVTVFFSFMVLVFWGGAGLSCFACLSFRIFCRKTWQIYASSDRHRIEPFRRRMVNSIRQLLYPLHGKILHHVWIHDSG